MNNKFRKGSGCFKCQSCGKLTRDTGQDDLRYCLRCEDRLQHENVHADNDFVNDECGDGDECLVKHYTEKQRWWLK